MYSHAGILVSHTGTRRSPTVYHSSQSHSHTPRAAALIVCNYHIIAILIIAFSSSAVIATRGTTGTPGVSFRYGRPLDHAGFATGPGNNEEDEFAGVDEANKRTTRHSEVHGKGSGDLPAATAVVGGQDFVKVGGPRVGWGRRRLCGPRVDTGALELCRGGAFEHNYGTRHDGDGGDGADHERRKFGSGRDPVHDGDGSRARRGDADQSSNGCDTEDALEDDGDSYYDDSSEEYDADEAMLGGGGNDDGGSDGSAEESDKSYGGEDAPGDDDEDGSDDYYDGSYEDYDTEEVMVGRGVTGEASEDDYDDYPEEHHAGDESGFTTDAELEQVEDGYEETDGEGKQNLPPAEGAGATSSRDDKKSIGVCLMTWNLAEESPPASDVDFLRRVAEGCDLVGVGVQEIENLKPRRNEGGRTKEWRRLLFRTLGKDFVRVGHKALGSVQLTLFARRALIDRVKVIKVADVACGVGNVLQNKGGIGAFVRVDRTTFLFIAAHLAAHQNKVEDRNADYWRIVSTLEQEIPPAWVTHAARKRTKRLKAAHAAVTTPARPANSTTQFSSRNSYSPKPESASASTAAVKGRDVPGRESGDTDRIVAGGAGGAVSKSSHSRGPFQDRVDRVFFFGDLNYRVDLSREDIEMGVSVARRGDGRGDGGGWGAWTGSLGRKGVLYPGTGALDALLDFDQLTRARSQGQAFGGFSEGRVAFEPTYKYNKGSEVFDTSPKMRPPAWTDRILFSPGGPSGVSVLEYNSEPGSSHSDHRPVYATFRVRLED